MLGVPLAPPSQPHKRQHKGRMQCRAMVEGKLDNKERTIVLESHKSIAAISDGSLADRLESASSQLAILGSL